MKIDFNDYAKAFENIIGMREMKKIIKFVSENLLCMKCKKFKPDIDFSKGQQFKNRRGRFPDCRLCQKSYYITKKVLDFEASKT
jgi:hypothetical protein